MREPAARKSRTRISSRKSARRSAASNGASIWRRFALIVDAEDSVPATALLETATGAHAAIEQSPRSWSRITVYVPRVDARKAAIRLKSMLRGARARRALKEAKLEEADVRDESWASSWKKFYTPFPIAPHLYIAPSWERRFTPPRGSRALWVDPGMAFGTGQHPTTQLALKLLLEGVRDGALVVDIGCGSGLLALAAAQRGARVYASDMDPIAVHATQANFAANKLSAVVVRRARDIPASFPRANLITANITARVLARLAPEFARKLMPAGLLITSGVVESGRAHILEALARARLELIEECRAENWYAHVHRKRPGS